MFNFTTYIRHLTATNTLAKSKKFAFGTCSGLGELQGAMDEMSNSSSFVILDTISSGETRQVGAGWHTNSTFFIFFLRHYTFGDEEDRIAQKAICDELARQFQSAFLHDVQRLQEKEQWSLGMKNMPYTDFNAYIGPGCTGKYIAITIDKPVDLCYHAEEWSE